MIIAYCANRVIYHLLPTTINSLIVNNPEIKKIYLLIEDDSIDYLTDSRIIFINCNKYNFLVRKGINVLRRFPYMAMTRCFLPLILTEPKVLYLDVDTIIDGNIKELWDLDISGKCVGASEEVNGYFNSGVLLMNLMQIRAGGYIKQLSRLLNGCKFRFPDQDAMNIVFKNSIAYIPSEFNRLGKAHEAEKYGYIIRHFAGITKPWQVGANPKDVELWNRYKVDNV